MIKNFEHKGLQRFFETGKTSGIQINHSQKLKLILSVLDKAKTIHDVIDVPSFRAHELKGNRAGCWSLYVNGNWRVTFYFDGKYFEIINYEDYH
ncbi:HigB toxin protein [uncultured Candidatus Thioglobus sp.]|nr:HigB toxin protein [uncultured Candidatus Thioglobus sp.]